MKPSQIGVLLRDNFGIPQVSGVTNSKILRILAKNGLAPPSQRISISHQKGREHEETPRKAQKGQGLQVPAHFG